MKYTLLDYRASWFQSERFELYPGEEDPHEFTPADVFREQVLGRSPKLRRMAEDVREIGSVGRGIVMASVDVAKGRNTPEGREDAKARGAKWLKLNLETARDCLREFIVGYKEAKAAEFSEEEVTMEQMYERAQAKYGEVQETLKEKVEEFRGAIDEVEREKAEAKGKDKR
ncbi:hypothetical protein TeGR_g7671 [Tetraparma gracilis]|uniref:Uncharacterized protein n=1 Tax=Tetraparma gracilis TaxID=2962635 RepID=A0ABQ6MUY9_9STRA|nr:hypothetical protein TeGR_g7671 [Tetraparma gracilis]